jgi:hypothetical protein
MATTTNYSWTTPDDTDLVKDGAAAIRTLGSSIDTTVFNNAGAAIQKSIVDAAGDLIYATADDTPARLAIGTAGQVLQVNSGATAPEWAAPASGLTFVGCSLYNVAGFVTIPNATFTAVPFTGEEFDTDGFHDNSTNNSRITIPSGKAGYYLIESSGLFVDNASGYREVQVYKNGATVSNPQWYAGYHNGQSRLQMVHTGYLAVGDYIQTYVYQNTGGNLDYSYELRFAISYLGA